MPTATPVHPEGPRYAASIVFLSGLWAPPRVWRPVASYLGHRGWSGTLLDVREGGGGIAARADRVVEHVQALSSPAILVGHDAGAPIALAAAARIPVRAVVLLSPLVAGAPGTHGVAWSRRLPWALVRRHPIAPPTGTIGAAFAAGVPADTRAAFADEDPRVLSELVRRSRVPRLDPLPPALVLRGAADPVVSAADARGLAADLAADYDEMPEQGHWPHLGPAWQDCARRLHRWLVQRLGETELEFYAEAMADREEER